MTTVDKKSLIIQAAVNVIAKHGYHGSQVSKIAQHAGVADGTIYLYFKNKDALLLGLFQDKVTMLMEQIEKAVSHKDNADEQLKALVYEHIRWLASDKDLAACVQLELRQSKKELRNELNRYLIPYHRKLQEILENGIEEGIFDPDMNLKFARQLIFGAIDEAISTWVVADFKYDIVSQQESLYYLIHKAVKKG